MVQTNDYIKRRVLSIAETAIRTRETVRQLALAHNTSKTTVHKDLTERLPRYANELGVSKELLQEVKKVLDDNKAARHIRGGESTKKKQLGKAKTSNSSFKRAVDY